MNSLNANARSIAERQANMAHGERKPEPPAKAGDVVPCLVCSGKGYVHSLHHVVCRVCKGTRTVTIEEYR